MQYTLYGFNVTIVLMYWIPKLILVSIDVLRPVITIFSSVNPTLVCLGLYDEDTVNRHDNVINLCCKSVVLDEKVIDDFVSVFWEFF